MILGFKNIFVAGILSGLKIHTIRTDKHNRWRKGNKIHFATGIRTKDYKQFYEGVCKGTQDIVIDGKYITIDGRLLSDNDVIQLAKNDGFDNVGDFYKFFNSYFAGKIIHWGNIKY